MNHSKELFKKYFSGSTTILETKLIEELLENNDAFRQECLDYFKQHDGDSDNILLRNKTFAESEKIKLPKKSVNKYVNVYTSISFLFILCIVTAFILSKNYSKIHHTTWIANNFKVTDTLPDGSIFYLNKNSKCYIPTSFNDEIRELYLEGEIFIDVEKNKDKPFYIYTNDLTVRVLGTKLNVISRGDITQSKVFVESGKVSVKPKNTQKEYFISKGEVVHFNNDIETNAIIEKAQINLNYWAIDKYNFENTPLGEVVASINKNSNTKFVFSDKRMEDCEFTGNFNTKSLDVFIDILNLSFGFDVEKYDSNLFLISGEVCD